MSVFDNFRGAAIAGVAVLFVQSADAACLDETVVAGLVAGYPTAPHPSRPTRSPTTEPASGGRHALALGVNPGVGTPG